MKASRSVTLACAILSVFMLLCSCGGSGGGSTASPSPASPSAASPSQTILPHEWTWTSGSDTVNHSGAYGATTGTPGTPGTRMTSASWTDPAGNFWLFGGYGYDSVGDNGVLNDLWEFTRLPPHGPGCRAAIPEISQAPTARRRGRQARRGPGSLPPPGPIRQATYGSSAEITALALYTTTYGNSTRLPARGPGFRAATT